MRCILLRFDSRTVGYEGIRNNRIALMNLEEYQYATMSAYSPTVSVLPLKGEPNIPYPAKKQW